MNFQTTRRTLLAAAALIGLGAFSRRHVSAASPPELAKEPPPVHTLEERLKPVLKGRTPRRERVALEVPAIAEDGSVVPVHIRVDSPMTPQNHVRQLTLLVDNNPDPLIFSGTLFPALGAAEWSIKIRMAESSRVRAIAEMSTGEMFADEKEVKVSLSGCG